MPAQGSLGRNMVLGFVAGALAVVFVHQVIVFLLSTIGWSTGRAWSLVPHGPWGVPTVVNSMFWGGLWGALFGIIWDKLPGSSLWGRGLLFGLLMTLVSNWTLLPLVRRALGATDVTQTVLFGGWDPKGMLALALILGAFGIGTAVIYGFINRQQHA